MNPGAVGCSIIRQNGWIRSGRCALILVGDGAFQMTGWELGNGSGYGWDQIVVVFNNAAWGMLQSFQPESAFNRPGE